MARKTKAQPAAAPKFDHKAAFAAFRSELVDLPFNDMWNSLECAEQNAFETDGVEPFSPEFWQVAYDGIAYTSDFNETAAVRDWFEARGYRW